MGLGLRTVFHLSLIVKNCLNCLTLCKKKSWKVLEKLLNFFLINSWEAWMTSICPSTKSLTDFDLIRCVGRHQPDMRTSEDFDPVHGQDQGR